MGWIRFTRWIPDDDSLYIGGVRIPSSVIESWQEWFEKKRILMRIERRNGRRSLSIDVEGEEDQEEEGQGEKEFLQIEEKNLNS